MAPGLPADLLDHLRGLTDPDRGGTYLAAGIARYGGGAEPEIFLTGRRHPDDTARDLGDWSDARMRVASVSKAATALAVAGLIADGTLGLDTAVGDLLPSPRWPKALGGITLAALLSHRSGLWDAAGYFTDPPETLPAFLARAGRGIRAPWPPGTRFFYANLNYVLAGAAIEAATGERMDRAVRARVLDPAAIAGGYNWADVPAANRARRLPMHQRRDARYDIEADGDTADWSADLIWRGGRGVGMAEYRPTEDTHLLSPHAGLRLSLGEMARLAAALGGDTPAARLCRSPLWRWDGVSDEGCDGLFPEIGLGLTLYRGHDRIPGPLVGHAGHALGFSGGIWANPDTGMAWAYALTGARDETEGRDTESFFPDAELAILRRF